MYVQYVFLPTIHTTYFSINKNPKRTPPWWSRSLGLAAWLGETRQNSPGTIFAMGWWRALSKGFFKLCKSAEKKINLTTTSILFYFFIIQTQSPPKMMILRFPSTSCSSRLPSIVPSIVAAVFGWLLCDCLLIGGHLRPRRFFLFFSFCHLIHRPQTIHQRPLPCTPLSAPPLYHLP